MTQRLLDPLERTSEILFGLIMVLTFTSSISVAEAGRTDTRTVLVGAIACNLAWGLVDAAMFLMNNLLTRARGLVTLEAVRQAGERQTAHRIILHALPPVVSGALTPPEVETLRQRLIQRIELDKPTRIHRNDVVGAAAVFLLVFLSTLPVAIPFFVVRDTRIALRVSNAVAAALMFAAGWSLGRYTGVPAWRAGLGMVAVGVGLVAVTIALGG